MRNRSALGLNTMWRLMTGADAGRFKRSCRRVEHAQQKILFRILSRNRKTCFGEKYRFSEVKDVRTFQRRLPLSDYESYRADVKRIQSGGHRVLTSDPVILLQPTSGSSGATKLIPYTQSLHDEFLKAIRPWMHDLLTRRPGLRGGTAYWSISPGVEEPLSAGGIPIGFRHDVEYLGRREKPVVRRLLAVPPEVRGIQNMEAFRYVTALFLLRDEALSFISVWNPSYLALLLSRVPEWHEDLISDVARGDISPDIEIPAAVRAALKKRIHPDRVRAESLRSIFKNPERSHSPSSFKTSLYEKIWPRLAMISCWTDGPSAGALPALKGLFPNVEIQPKGLIATEGVVSFPLIGHPGAALAVNSHFLEFIPLEEDLSCRSVTPLLATELRPGERYSVVLTTSGGLYRYRLRDMIEVVDFFRKCPLVRFIGKEAAILDMFGEKLHSGFVERLLRAVFAQADLEPAFYMLAPERTRDGTSARYVLYLQTSSQAAPEKMQGVAEAVEARLQENFHYRYCRRLGQLNAAGVYVLHPDEKAQEKILNFYHQRGQTLGNIKTAVLGPLEGLAGKFEGFYLK